MFGVTVSIECCRINPPEPFPAVKKWWLVSISWVAESYSVVSGPLIDTVLLSTVLAVPVESVVVTADAKLSVMNTPEKTK